jgi:hypothetical protein
MRTHRRGNTLANTRGAFLTQVGLFPHCRHEFAQQETVTVSIVIDKEPHDIALVIDPIRIRVHGSRCIDRSEFATSEQETMIVVAVVNGDPNDITS